MRNTIITASLLAATFAASAAPPEVWRCGNTYGSVRCEGGTLMGAPPPVSAAEAARARSVGKADAKLADALEKARLQQEKQAPKAVIPVVTPAAQATGKPAKKPTARKGAPSLLTAVTPGSKEEKKK